MSGVLVAGNTTADFIDAVRLVSPTEQQQEIVKKIAGSITKNAGLYVVSGLPGCGLTTLAAFVANSIPGKPEVITPRRLFGGVKELDMNER
jgi:superfamily II DNA or RNA helicase